MMIWNICFMLLFKKNGFINVALTYFASMALIICQPNCVLIGLESSPGFNANAAVSNSLTIWFLPNPRKVRFASCVRLLPRDSPDRRLSLRMGRWILLWLLLRSLCLHLYRTKRRMLLVLS